MTKKSLVLYASLTGNTEKVAGIFAEVFARNEWECDVFKIDSNIDPANPPFTLADYDFLCVGSPVIGSLPVRDVLNILSKNPSSPHKGNLGLMCRSLEEIKQNPRGPRQFVSIAPKPVVTDEPPLRIKFGPGDRKGIVFVSFGGVHLGPKEAVPSLALLESEMEHLRFQCVGKFACPGGMGRAEGWFKDLHKRPHERDLRKAETFLEEILEEMRD